MSRKGGNGGGGKGREKGVSKSQVPDWGRLWELFNSQANESLQWLPTSLDPARPGWLAGGGALEPWSPLSWDLSRGKQQQHQRLQTGIAKDLGMGCSRAVLSAVIPFR